MLTQFLKLKYRTFRPRGGVHVRGVDIANCSLERSTTFVYTERELNFSVVDCRFVPTVKATETTVAIGPFLSCVGENSNQQSQIQISGYSLSRTMTTRLLQLNLQRQECQSLT